MAIIFVKFVVVLCLIEICSGYKKYDQIDHSVTDHSNNNNNNNQPKYTATQIASAFKKYKIIPDLIDVAPSNLLQVSFCL